MSSPDSSQNGYPTAYRPGGYAPTPAERASTGLAVAPPSNAASGFQTVWAPTARTSNQLVLTLIGVAVLAIALLVMIIAIMRVAGLGPTIAGFVLALVPLAAVLLGVMWLDRWEPEPKLLLLLALLWGAGASTLSSLALNTFFQQAIYNVTGDAQAAMVQAATIIAPIVEESCKGLGLLLIYLWRREHFDGPVDGIVYAATIAAGFAFTENILYLARTPDTIWIVFVGRGLMSPFAHLLFTACMGVGIGLASRVKRFWLVLPAFTVSLTLAMGMHSLWNSASFMALGFLWIYVLVFFPMFVSIIVLLYWLRRQESEVVASRLTEYAEAGWFAPHEVTMLASLRQRSQARTWSSRYGVRAKTAMAQFQRDSTQLAYLRQRQLTGRANLRASRSEHELLNSITAVREQFSRAAAPASPQPGMPVS